MSCTLRNPQGQPLRVPPRPAFVSRFGAERWRTPGLPAAARNKPRKLPLLERLLRGEPWARQVPRPTSPPSPPTV